jgi:hypothetical protein
MPPFALSDLSRSSEVKGHDAKWKSIYDFLSVINRGYRPKMHCYQDTCTFSCSALSDLSRSSKVKGHDVKWRSIYDFLCMLNSDYRHKMHRYQDMISFSSSALCDPPFALSDLSRSSEVKCYDVKWKSIYDLLSIVNSDYRLKMHRYQDTCSFSSSALSQPYNKAKINVSWPKTCI